MAGGFVRGKTKTEDAESRSVTAERGLEKPRPDLAASQGLD
jgi:hypothetical protein